MEGGVVRRHRTGTVLDSGRVVATLAAEPEGTERLCTSFGLPVSKSTRTHHFRALREAGLVKQVDRGNSRTAQLRRADLDARFPGLLRPVIDNPGVIPWS